MIRLRKRGLVISFLEDKSVRIVGLLIVSLGLLIPAFAQSSPAEKEIVAAIDGYTKALRAKDVDGVSAFLSPDYSYTNPYGTKETRADFLDFIKSEKASPTFTVNGFLRENLAITQYGDTAIVAFDWTMDSTSKNARASDPTHRDKGRSTIVVIKRSGKWLVAHEHDSEQQHDKPSMEKQVLALSRAYTDMIRRNDAASIAGVLADDYIVTDENGKRFTKDEDLATYKDRANTLKIETVEYKDQKVRMLTGSVAIDHSTIRFVGTKNGKPFDITERITTTFQFRDGRWLIVADHFSFVR